MDISPIALFEAVQSDVEQVFPIGDSPVEYFSDNAAHAFAAHSLVKDLVRKWTPSDKEAQPIHEQTLAKFLEVNTSCLSSRHAPQSWYDEVFGSLRQVIDDFFHPRGSALIESYEDILDFARCGPGSSIGSLSTSLYSKLFDSPLTTTSPDLYFMYRLYLLKRRRWLDAEIHRQSLHGDPVYVDSSKCIFVPKTSTSSRMVCVEPSLNMFFQLGFAAILEERLRSYFSIDLSTQPQVNQRLAKSGAIDGSFATIDLSSASDTLSMYRLSDLLPDWLKDMLSLLRCSSTTYKGRRIPLNMISTMGNGFTFPLQTVIFSSVISAVYRTLGLPFINGVTFACFGDDLVVLSKAFDLTIKVIEACGFLPNLAKTFSEGPFRESCGSDWYNHVPVRPVFIKKLRSPQDACSTINSLIAWSSQHQLPLRRTVSVIRDGFRSLPLVPASAPEDSGVRCPSQFLKEICYDENGSYVYRGYQARQKYIIPKGGSRYSRSRRLSINPDGLFLSFLYGELRDGRLSARLGRTTYRLKMQRSPNWDYVPTSHSFGGEGLAGRYLEDTFSLNWEETR
jgi:hypothetical protein